VSDGTVQFVRFAYPPTALGYCGPDQHRELLEYGTAAVSDPGLMALARRFEGAWPYLELIAHANGIADPLDSRVVEAYWIGNRLLDRVDPARFASFLAERFHGRVGRDVERLVEAIPAGARPHHNFHVFGVYPWVGLMRTDRFAEPLRIVDRCRIRWGRAVAVRGEVATVRFRPLTWDGSVLALGEPREEQAVWRTDGYGFIRDLRPGDTVALHWDWVCDRLTPRQLAFLRRSTDRHLAIANLEQLGRAPALSG
jgi:hypothetical protein